MNNQEKHYINRSGWLRAAVLGDNDGILSTASIIIGVAAASSTREPIIIAGVAGLVAGALSMAAGEYVSVSSQTDIEKSDLEREKQELIDIPEQELIELAKIYEERGPKQERAWRWPNNSRTIMHWKHTQETNWELWKLLKQSHCKPHCPLVCPLL